MCIPCTFFSPCSFHLWLEAYVREWGKEAIGHVSGLKGPANGSHHNSVNMKRNKARPKGCI